jgi:hypothetical protein
VRRASEKDHQDKYQSDSRGVSDFSRDSVAAAFQPIHTRLVSTDVVAVKPLENFLESGRRLSHGPSRLMSLRHQAAIVGIGETPADRLGSKPGEPRQSSAQYLARAMRLAFEDAGLSLEDFQGQGLGVTMPTAYPQPFWPEEAAETLGIAPGFLLGGATTPRPTCNECGGERLDWTG